MLTVRVWEAFVESEDEPPAAATFVLEAVI